MDVIRFRHRVWVGGKRYEPGEDIEVEDATEFLAMGADLISHTEPEKPEAPKENKPQAKRGRPARG